MRIEEDPNISKNKRNKNKIQAILSVNYPKALKWRLFRVLQYLIMLFMN